MKLHKGINQTEIAVRYYERKGKNISREQAQKNMKHIKKFNEMKRFTKEGKNVITRNNEMNVIAYQIPNNDDFILGRTPDRKWVVQTSDGVMLYSTNEMEELYILDLIESDIGRLTWPA